MALEPFRAWNPQAPTPPAGMKQTFGATQPAGAGQQVAAGVTPASSAYAQGQVAAGNSAGAAANAAGNYAANNSPGTAGYYASGGKWSPGLTPPPQGSAAYQDYVNYGQGQANAGAAANAAGNYAATRGAASHEQALNDERQAAADKAGLDFMTPGAMEQFWSTYGGQVMQPGATEKYQSQYGNALAGPGASSRYASTVLGRDPNLPNADPSAYYDRAVDKTTQKMNAELAARGSYGSSVGLGALGGAVADIRAQQAKDSADYGLRRSDLERSWTSTYGDLAATSDSSDLARWNAGLTGAAAADSSGLQRWNAGRAGAGDAQAAQRARGRDLFSDNMAIGGALSGVAGSNYDDSGTQDQALLDAIIALGIGQGAEGVAAAYEQARGNKEMQQQILNAFALYKQSQPTTTTTTSSGPGGTETRSTKVEQS